MAGALGDLGGRLSVRRQPQKLATICAHVVPHLLGSAATSASTPCANSPLHTCPRRRGPTPRCVWRWSAPRYSGRSRLLSDRAGRASSRNRAAWLLPGRLSRVRVPSPAPFAGERHFLWHIHSPIIILSRMRRVVFVRSQELMNLLLSAHHHYRLRRMYAGRFADSDILTCA